MDVIFNEIFPDKKNQNNALGVITLNRPHVLNALTLDMLGAMRKQLQIWQESTHIQAVVIEGAGDRAFCAGGDIRSLYADRSLQQSSHFFNEEYQVNAAIYHYSKPYIALLQGLTMGGGVGLSIPGRWRIATDRFVFAMPETKIGFFPDVGMCYFLARLSCKWGYYLALTGDSITAQNALALGLVDAVIAHEQLPIFRKTLFSNLALHPVDATVFDLIEEYKESHHSSLQEELMDKALLIKQHFSLNNIEEIIASLMSSTDPWCQETAKKLLFRSPSSLKVTLYHLQCCEQLSFREVLAQDKVLAYQFLHHHDFFEGIRASIIDKDNIPQWMPSQLTQVSSQLVKHYFSPF